MAMALSPQGWTKTVVPRKRAPKKDVVFISPTGVHIRSRRQLERFLESCSEGHTMSDFDWSTGVRSNCKRRLPTEEPVENENKGGENDESPTKRLHVGEAKALAEISNLQITREPSLVVSKSCNSPEPPTAKRALNLSPAPETAACPDLPRLTAAKTALHLSTVPETILCRKIQLQRIVEFSRDCFSRKKSGSLYVCGCPGTGKSLAMEKLKGLTTQWAKEGGSSPPQIVSINCTTLTDARQIYCKIAHALQPENAEEKNVTLEHLKRLLAFKRTSNQMQLLIIDEMDYLITREQSVLYDLFQLTVPKGSSCVLIGIANAIDLTERFLPRLRTLNCNPDVITFPAYSKEQILEVLNQRISVLPVPAFHSVALELCARKVSAASGDMRKALYACRAAIDLLEAEVKEKQTQSLHQELVQIDHMARALAKVFRSPVIETIQALPQQSQIILSSAVRLFRNGKKDAPLSELNKFYISFCKTTGMHPVSCQEFSGMCQLIADQGLMNLGNAREDRLKKVKLQVDHDDVVFALQGIRFFRNNLV